MKLPALLSPSDALASSCWRSPQPPPSAGLAQAEDALRRTGPIRLDAYRDRAYVLKFAARFANPLVLTLLVASAISAAMGEVGNLQIILLIVLPFTPLGALFQLVPPPPGFFAWLAGLVLAYLALAEAVKHRLLSRLMAHAPRRHQVAHR